MRHVGVFTLGLLALRTAAAALATTTKTLTFSFSSAEEPVGLQQPELAPQAWFLSEEEMTDSRGGVPRDALYLWTANNTVATFVATSECFDSVYKDLKDADADDHVWITGWSFDDVVLQPQVDEEKLDETKLVNVLQRLASKGVDLRLLGWTNIMEFPQNIKFADAVRAIEPSSLQGDSCFMFDDRVPDPTGSHHQKTVTIQGVRGTVAYVGGVDLTWDRWDTIHHNASDVRTRADIERTDMIRGWMDVHLKINGPAAEDVVNNFRQRWNMKYQPLQDTLDELQPFDNPTFSVLPDPYEGGRTLPTANGSQAVQIVRTYSCKYGHYDGFAPKGEHSVLQSQLKAIKMAKNFIFIEDQYFVHVPQLMDALLEVLPKIQRLVILTQPPPPAPTGYKKYQWQMIKPLTDKYPNKVQVFRTKAARNIYIHSKLVLVDDVFLSIGSANWNRRSMTTDTEIAANVVDDNTVKTPDGVFVGKVARDYRVRKFMEMTGKSYAEIDGMKLSASFDALTAAANDPSTILAPYTSEEDSTFALHPSALQALTDPLQLCTDQT